MSEMSFTMVVYFERIPWRLLTIYYTDKSSFENFLNYILEELDT